MSNESDESFKIWLNGKEYDLTKSEFNFTYNHEVGTGKYDSLKPHWPGSSKSGVTIGPGYDMGGRIKDEIKSDLEKAGVDTKRAEALSGAEKLTGKDAEDWKNKNDHLTITEEQQKKLFEEVLVPEYIARIDNHLKNLAKNAKDNGVTYTSWDNLTSYQRVALFDIHYNPGLAAFPAFTKAILKNDWETASDEYKRFVDGKPLTLRNNDFYEEFFRYPKEPHFIFDPRLPNPLLNADFNSQRPPSNSQPTDADFNGQRPPSNSQPTDADFNNQKPPSDNEPINDHTPLSNDKSSLNDHSSAGVTEHVDVIEHKARPNYQNESHDRSGYDIEELEEYHSKTNFVKDASHHNDDANLATESHRDTIRLKLRNQQVCQGWLQPLF